MNFRFYILPFLLLFFVGSAFGQKKGKKSFKSNKQTSQMLLEEARMIKDKSPTKAIELIERALTMSRKQKRGGVEGEAYLLLGNIYEQIDQDDLALQRYQQALPYLGRKKGSNQKAKAYERMGRIYLAKKRDKDAERNFTFCLDNTYDKMLSLKCEEGLIDVQLLRNETILLDSIRLVYNLDSTENARLETRQSRYYLQQNDIQKATENHKNTFDQLPVEKIISKEDYEQIQITQDQILKSDQLTNQEKIEVRSGIANNAKLNFSNDAQVKENLKIAELYEADKNYVEAERFIEVSKDLIKPETDAVIAAEVFKKSSELKQNQGKIAESLKDLEAYTLSKEKAIRLLENDLKEQIEIVKGQQQIDLLQRDYDLEEKDKSLMQSQLRTQKIIIGLLSLILLASLVFFYFLYKNVKEKRKANQRLLLKSLRTQMNPHFIFNALNSVNNFIAKNDEKAANKFLSEFSRLMRKVLDYSQKDFISFEEEIELNELYLKLEHFRFRDKFEYVFQNNTSKEGYDIEVPPMLIQPFIENAVWHGLRYKEGKGQLDVEIKELANNLIVIVKDNGIGREKSKALKTKNQKKYKSTGLENVSKRIGLINEIYNKNYKINVSDLYPDNEETGTIVEISIPV